MTWQVGIDYYLANAPLQKNLYSDDIGSVAAALCTPGFGAVTGEVHRRVGSHQTSPCEPFPPWRF